MRSISRRRFLQQALAASGYAGASLPVPGLAGASMGSSVLGIAGVAGLAAGASLTGTAAQAATGDYRALVCVFLYGGNDGHNMLPPVAASAYGRYAQVRGALAIPAASIVALDADIGLHPAMAPMADIWQEGRLAVVNNVGPLSRPTTREDYFAWKESSDNSLVPDSLFSHEDQQYLWENATSDAMVRTGWGGRLMEAVSSGAPVYSFGGNSRFGTGTRINEMVLPHPGTSLGLQGFYPDRFSDARMNALMALVAAGSENRLHAALTDSQQRAFEASSRLGPMLEQGPKNGADPANPEIASAFGNLSGEMANPLARQLYQVAKMIKNRAIAGSSRQVFVVQLGGFDHHANQLSQHAGLLANLGSSLAAFDRALTAMGMNESVTTFTQSDFGRTLKPNKSAGTDHAWGNMQLVMGGSVRGGRQYGVYPSLELGGPDDAGRQSWEHQGRWIPGISVDQYAATLVQWFAPQSGATLARILPNLSRFPIADLGFMA